jgi:outer membrane protein assembly factor BamB
MSSTGQSRGRSLGDIDPAGSRQRGRRSSVAIAGGTTVAGTHDGEVIAYEGSSDDPAWRAAVGESVVTLAADERSALVVAGTRGADGRVRAFDRETGAQRWSYRVADDVGGPQKETRFCLPFVVDARVAEVDGEVRAFVAGRRYERRQTDEEGDAERHFESVVYAFESDGTVAWRYAADASAISLDADGERVAVGYNRCPGGHQCGLVVLDATDGELRATWDPGTDGQRRVGDVSLVTDGVAVASHGDYRGYMLDRDGAVRWRVDLGTPTSVDGERLYAYPNHVYATADGVLFVTGNTYPEEGREADGRHPNEHTVTGFDLDGGRRWSSSVGGWVTGVGTDGSLVATPVAQHFRDRDPAVHGLRVFDVADGQVAHRQTDGIVTAGDVSAERVAGVEEPVVYHDEGHQHGTYRLQTTSIDG